MIEWTLWLLTLSLTGWVAFPLVQRLLPWLPGQGYAVSRIAGLLIWGYTFWLLASLGWLRNDPGGILVAWLVLAGLAAWSLRQGGWERLRKFWDEQRGYVITTEILFVLAFLALAVVRAANPEILGTEKPMEVAFINAILNSPTFPPHDPWLSGYAISYYYFGYVLVALLAKLTNTAGAVAFNLGLAAVFALSANGVYGLVYDLLRKVKQPPTEEKPAKAPRQIMPEPQRGLPAWLGALFGPLFVLILSNLGGLLEMLHAGGVFWSRDASGNLTSTFWNWLNIKEWNLPPAEPFDFAADRYYWWWRASRVVHDVDLVGNSVEVIDEFPFFSYLLGDLHPHVLAMPFAFLAIAVALNLFFGRGQGAFRLGRLDIPLPPASAGFAVLSLGGLAFLNTWDFPIYVALFSGAAVLSSALSEGWNWARLRQFLVLGLVTGVAGVLLYLPFYIGFSSQAGGILPNLIYPTRGAQLWVMFGVLFIPLIALLLYVWRSERWQADWRGGLLLAGGLVVGLWLFSLLFGYAISLLPTWGDAFIGTHGAADRATVFTQALLRRFSTPGGWLTLLGLLAACLALLIGARGSAAQRKPVALPAGDPKFQAEAFAVLMALIGALLVLAPEFVYLRDQFTSRMNTVFKFYYQAWILWGSLGAFATALLLERLAGMRKLLFAALTALSLIGGLAYPVLGLQTKTNNFDPPGGWTLDGSAHLGRQSAAELAAVNWLAQAPDGVIAEAIGGQYSAYGRMATYSGKPNVLGWPGHEVQWRGGSEEMGSRQVDITRLYCSEDISEAQLIIEKYEIRYVVVGSLERGAYQPDGGNCPVGLVEAKFERFLPVVFRLDEVTIYASR